jgi:hypothetical protein
MQSAAPVAPIGPHDGVDTQQSASREQPRTVLLSSRNELGSCRIPAADHSNVQLSEDETRVAVRTGDRLSIWNPRTCQEIAADIPDVIGMTFIGTGHDLLLVHDSGGVSLSRIAKDGSAKLAGTNPQRPTAWATSPDGKLAVVGVTDETRSTLAVWDLTERRATFDLKLPVVEREITNIAFSRDSTTATLTIPVFSTRRSETVPRWQLEIDYDTTTWRPTRKAVVAFRLAR